MAKIIIPRSELPIPVSDHINKFRFRVVNDNRNIYSDWSVINHVYQVELDPNSTRGIPSPTNPGDVLTPIVIDPVDNWDIGWIPVATWAEENGIVTTDTNYDVPAGGTTGQVLTKMDDVVDSYNISWEDPTGGGGGGNANPQDGNLVIGIMILT